MNRKKHSSTDWQYFEKSDWENFQKSLLKQIPFVDNDLHLKGIENFVKTTINRYMPKSIIPLTDVFNSSKLNYEIFETHRSIFVRCRLPEGISLKDIKFFANRRTLKIEFPESTEDISLPSDVNSSRPIAKLQDGILEIRMPKFSGSDPFREIFVRDGK